MNHPKVSIVIPVYNGSDFLGEAINSALSQSYSNLEIVVVNDGSDDHGETERIALSYGDSIRYFSKQNGGVASALNMAIDQMTGDYFSWLSHDDLYTADKVEREMMAVFEADNAGAVIYSDYAVFTGDPRGAIPVRLPGVPPEHFRYWITVENRLHGCTLLVPRTAFARTGMFDISLRTTQDYDLWFRMASQFEFIHVPEVLVKARSHSGQGSHTMGAISLAECNTMLTRFIHQLSHREILAAAKLPLGEAYREIGAGMYRRGFNEAGKTADRLASLYTTPSNGGFMFNHANSVARLRSRIIGAIRRKVPRKLKVVVKSMLPRPVETHMAHGNTTSSLRQKFTEVYEKNTFGGRVSRSGEGSDLVQTAVIRRELPKLIKTLGVKTFLDAPCGDWCWMKETALGVELYTGVDIVEVLIEKNRREFGNGSTSFLCMDLAVGELPRADLIFSRDCLVHLPFEDSLRIIANFKRSGSTYFLTTTFTGRARNDEMVGKKSFWSPLNMRLPPFNFPEPMLLINEGCTEEDGQFADKCLGLWRLDDIQGG
jgi:glycosyltransferase involved in cell wall biosynthesis